MNEFDELKAAARAALKTGFANLDSSAQLVSRARHNFDQAEGAIAQLESVLEEAPDEVKPEIARRLDEATRALELSKKDLDQQIVLLNENKAQLEQSRADFIATFHEDPQLD